MEPATALWAQNFVAFMIAASANGGGRDYRHPIAPRGTPKRLHRHNHTMHAGRGRLLRGRFGGEVPQ